MKSIAGVALIAMLGLPEVLAQQDTEKSFVVHPIGHVEKKDGRTLIVLEKKYQLALLGLAG